MGEHVFCDALGLCGAVAAGLSMRRLAVALFTLRARALTPLLLRLAGAPGPDVSLRG